MNVLKRAGASIDKLLIGVDLNGYTYPKIIINNIPKYCKNLSYLGLYNFALSPETFNDENITQIFNENQNLEQIRLKGFNRLDGDCLLKLNKNQIKELCLYSCRFNTKGYLYAFLGSLKNLNDFLIEGYHSEVNDALAALVMGECDNMFQIEITSGPDPEEYLWNNFEELQLIPSLSKFFSKQKKIVILKLKNVFLDQQILEIIPINSLEELSLHYDNTNLSKKINLNFTLFLSKQEKLRTLSLRNLEMSDTFDGTLNGVASNNILENVNIYFENKQTKDINLNVSLFLSRNNYYKLTLYNILINEKLLNSLPTKHLETLDLHFIDIKNYEVLSNFFARLSNLIIFEGHFGDINDNHLREIIKNVNSNIKNVIIRFEKYSPSSMRIGYFNRLQNLISFVFVKENNEDDIFNEGLANILEELTVCKNLEHLDINCYHLTELEIKAISNMVNLVELHISFCNVVGDELIGDLIKKLVYLDEICIEKFELVTKNLLNLASKIKCERGDTRVLGIHFIECPKIENDEFEAVPFVDGYMNSE